VPHQRQLVAGHRSTPVNSPATVKLRRARKSPVVHHFECGLALQIGLFTRRRTAVVSQATVAGIGRCDDAGGEIFRASYGNDRAVRVRAF
jgi:hypothetical protein